MPVLLMYNLDNEKGRLIRAICLRLKIRIQNVNPAEFGQPVGALAGLSPRLDAACESPFADEMLLFVNFSNPLLDRFLTESRKARASVALKAVLTPTNAAWTSAQLHNEISREHEAMRAQMASVHKEG